MNNAAPAAPAMIDPEQLQQALAQLHDISTPADPSWWPLAPGWWVLFGLVLAMLVAVVVFSWWWRKTALRRVARQELQQLEHNHNQLSDQAFLMQAAHLLRRLCLQQDDAVAGLTDAAWADYLNQRGQTNFFTTQAGEQLLQARFGRPEGVERQRYLDALAAWIAVAVK